MSTLELCGPATAAQLEWSHTDVSESDSRPWSVRKFTLRSGWSTGVEVIAVDNGACTVFLIPTRGLGLWKIETSDVRIGWDAPVPGPVHPALVNLRSRHGLGWLDGFSELLCRCGLAFNGPPGIDDGAASPIESEVTLHGQIANRPAETVVAEFVDGAIVIRGEVREATLFGPNLKLVAEYRIPLGSTRVELTDRVTNLASRTAEMQLLYHINVGTPLLQAGGRWAAPLRNVYPRDARAAEGLETRHDYLGPTAGYAEQVYFCDLIADSQGQSLAVLAGPSESAGLRLDFDTRSLPCFAVWKNTQPLADGYCTGLEPATNYPNFKAVERQNGRVVRLESGETWTGSLAIEYLSNADQVAAALKHVDQLQGVTVPVVHPSQAGLTVGL